MVGTMGRRNVPAWFWIVAILALLWEAMGCYAYLTQISMDAADLAKLPPAQADTWRAMPTWIKADYAVAVWVGLSGAIGLLMRQRWAREAFAVSLVAVLLQFGWVYLASPAALALGLASAGLPIAIIIAGIFLLGFANHAIRRGWLR
jgi:hypothetical protein